jgi:hypothetical protein
VADAATVTLSVDPHPTDDAVVLSSTHPFVSVNLEPADALRVANALVVRSIEVLDRRRAAEKALAQLNPGGSPAEQPPAPAKGSLFPSAGPYRSGL